MSQASRGIKGPGLRILITNFSLAYRGGSQLYVRDVALALLKRGHTPIVYSPQLGEVAQEIHAATIPVVDNLDALSEPPDLIHGQHHVETMTALLHFPGVPAVCFCHGWLPWEETPPKFPRILRYVAVDYTCRDRLIWEHAIPEERIRVLLNFVDLERFKLRGPLPTRPERALIFSNNANEYTHLKVVRAACDQAGIPLDVMGLSAGNVSPQPELIIGNYDLIFAKGRAALEGLAVGVAVILCDAKGAGPMVTTGELDQLRSLNLGIRTLREPVNADILGREIARYDAQDAAQVSQIIRATAGCDTVVDALISLYQEVIAEYATRREPLDMAAEERAAAVYLHWLGLRLKERDLLQGERDSLQAELATSQQTMQHYLAQLEQKEVIILTRDQGIAWLKGELANKNKSPLKRIAHSLRGRLHKTRP